MVQTRLDFNLALQVADAAFVDKWRLEQHLGKTNGVISLVVVIIDTPQSI